MSYTQEQIGLMIREEIRQQLGLGLAPDTELKSETKLYDLMDSLDMVELSMNLEDVFAIELSDDEIEKIQTIAQLETLIQSKVNINQK